MVCYNPWLPSRANKGSKGIGKDWDESVSLALFAACQDKQKSLGFSPAELLFRHSVLGLLGVLRVLFYHKSLTHILMF